MSSAFKHKTSKQMLMDDKNITTLDSVHKEKQAEFNYIKTIIIPKLKAEYKEIKQQLKASGIGIETRLEKNDRAIEISTSLREYKTRITDYYLKNNKYIFSYFETKKDISNSAGDALILIRATQQRRHCLHPQPPLPPRINHNS